MSGDPLVPLLTQEVVEPSARDVARILRKLDPAKLLQALQNGADPEIPFRSGARPVSSFRSRPVDWLWEYRIPLGMLSEIIGDPGEGKSFLTLELATAVSLGRRLPGDGVSTLEPGCALLVCPEDSPEFTVRPRLEAMGADLDRISILDGIRAPGEHPVESLDLSSETHRRSFLEEIRHRRARLVVIDPISAHLGKANEYKDSEVRAVLAPLAQIAAETGAAIVLVRHLRKAASDRAVHRAGGSIAFTAVCRASLLVGRPAIDPSRRAVVRVKGNLSPVPPAVAFTLEDGQFAWTEAGDWTPEDILQARDGTKTQTALAEAVEWLKEVLGDGPLPATQVYRLAGEAGISKGTLRRAAQQVGRVARRQGAMGKDGHWEWLLPERTEDPAKALNPPRITDAPSGEHLRRKPKPDAKNSGFRTPNLFRNGHGDGVAHLSPNGGTRCDAGCGGSVGRPGVTCAACKYGDLRR